MKQIQTTGTQAGWFVALSGAVAAVFAVVTALLGVVPHGLAVWTHQVRPAACTEQPAFTVGQPGRNGQVGPEFELTVDVRCPPTATDRYALIGQRPDAEVDPANPHPEYYLIWRLDRPVKGQYTHQVDLSSYPVRSTVTYHVIRLDEAAHAELIAGPHGRSVVLTVPDQHLVTSNRITVVRSW